MENVQGLEPGIALSLALDRARRLADVRYALHLTIPSNRLAHIAATLTVTFHLEHADAPLVLDFAPGPEGRVRTLRVNDSRVEPELSHGHLVLAAALLRPGPNTVRLEFTAGDGPLNRRADHLYTIFVPARAHEALPCFDQPDLKARWSLSLDVPAAWTAVANGRVERQTPHLDAAGEARATVSFAETAPLPTYLFAFAAGRLTERVFVRRDRSLRVFHTGLDDRLVDGNLDAIVDGHLDALRWMEDYTDIAYPFGKLDVVLLPAFQFGGMEHPGAIFYNASVVLLAESATRQQRLARATVIAHETAHMWFGDLVTMRWFDDVWMKEVFANFMAAKIVNPQFDELDHDLRFLHTHYPAAYDVDRTGGTHAIRQPLPNIVDAGSLYGAIIYLKSPIVMRQLELLLGEEVLRDALRVYLTTFAFGNAAWPDLLALLAAHAPMAEVNLREWSRDWLEVPGRPLVQVERLPVVAPGDEAGAVLTTPNAGMPDVRWPQRLDVAFGVAGIVHHASVMLDGRAEVRLAGARGTPDFVLPNGRGLGYGQFTLDVQSRDWLLQHLPDVADALTRGSAWLTLWDEMLDGRVAPERLLAVMLRALPREASELNLQRLLACTERVFWTFLDEQGRAGVAPELESTLRACLQAPGSISVKAAYFACLRATATSPDALQWLRGVWASTATVPGLPLGEADLVLLTQELAVRGDDGDALVEAQVARTFGPDRRAALAFVAPALSSDVGRRDAFFRTISTAEHRTREPWVIDGLRWLHHPLREVPSLAYVEPGLELLEEVKRTGDIFLPKRWLDAMLGGHGSADAARLVRAFVASRPDSYPRALTRMVLASADLLFRAAARTDARG